MCEPARTVVARNRGYVHMEMAAVVEDRVYSETGNVFDHAPSYFRTAPPTVAITLDASHLLALLHERYAGFPGWRYTLYKTHSDYGDRGSVSRVKLTTFGFRGNGHRKQRLHQCWDPRSVSPDVSARFLDDASPASLLAWGCDLRAWAEENNLELRNAFAGYASQLLRDERFYPEPRRRVPKATNEAARPALPGNLITLHADRGESHTVTCVDQVRAHHRIVQEIPLASSNHLFARGYFVDYENAQRYWAPRSSELFRQIRTRHHGLLYVGLESRMTVNREDGLRLPLQNYQGYKRQFVWTNQLDFLEATGSRVSGVYAAWTSTTVDDGLARYGEWAESQLTTASPARKRWLKPLLHSAYGLLAARPRPLEVGHLSDTTPHTMLLGAREFPVKAVKLKNVTPVFVNVVQRGMIEAETQIRSLTMARTLHDAGCDILHVHADGLHVQGDLPLLPATWSVSTLTDVLYLDRVSWIARERACLPGRDERARHEEAVHFAKLIATRAESRRHPSRGLRRHLQRATRHPQAPQGEQRPSR